MISGCNRGIGASIAHRLYQDGWRLSLAMRDPKMPDWVSDTDSVHLYPYEATAGTEQAWVQAVNERWGQIDFFGACPQM